MMGWGKKGNRGMGDGREEGKEGGWILNEMHCQVQRRERLGGQFVLFRSLLNFSVSIGSTVNFHFLSFVKDPGSPG